MKHLLLLAALAAVAAEAPAAAQFQQFKAKDRVTVDSSVSYVVIRTNFGTDLRLFKLVDDGDRQRWGGERQAAYDKVRKKYERDLRNYERDIEEWNDSASGRREMRVKPKKPAEVTLEGTPIASVEMANFQVISRGREIAQDADKTRTFLIALAPGTYVFNGAAGAVGAIGVGSCFCMGSVAFVAEAGKVIDAGTLRTRGDWYAPVDYVPAPAAPSVPAQLAGQRVVPARVIAAGKMANFFSTPVTRVNPVPGILSYNRDIPIDVAGGNQPVEAIR